jgi:hypothetical protein
MQVLITYIELVFLGTYGKNDEETYQQNIQFVWVKDKANFVLYKEIDRHYNI